MKKVFSIIAALVAAAQILTLSARAESVSVPSESAPALTDEAEREISFEKKSFLSGSAASPKYLGEIKLQGPELELYNLLLAEIKEIAAGKKDADVMYFSVSTPFSSEAEYEKAVKRVMFLVENFSPEETYWIYAGGFLVYNLTDCGIVYTVSAYYQHNGDETKLDPAKRTKANAAVANAKKLADKYKYKSDYDKIVGYAEEICRLNTYNDKAADDDSYSETDFNPWNIIYVFDGNSKTNVVCGGYARAFQYLCKLGNVECYYMLGFTSGLHAWNIVKLNGAYYHVDVTGTDAYPFELLRTSMPYLLNGAATLSKTKYTVKFTVPGYYETNDAYVLDESVLEFYPQKVFSLSRKDFDSAEQSFKTGSKLTFNNIMYTVKSDGTLEVTGASNPKTVKTASITSEYKSMKVTSIADKAFKDCAALTSVTIPSGIKTIGESAFQNCTKLSKLSIPSSVGSIGNYAFFNCSGMKTLTLKNGVKTIGWQAFAYCGELTSVTVPKSVTECEGAFMCCSKLKTIKTDSASTKFCSSNGVLFNKSKTVIVQYPAGKTASSYSVPNTVKTISNGAFSGSANLTSVTVPSGITEISYCAFSHCGGLTSIKLPKSVTVISQYAFEDCEKLKTLNYTGTSAQWKKTSVASGNDRLKKCAMKYNVK